MVHAHDYGIPGDPNLIFPHAYFNFSLMNRNGTFLMKRKAGRDEMDSGRWEVAVLCCKCTTVHKKF